ncbi:protein kinase [Streptomyces sp. NPDC087440]|uniref:protein kinase domain-containing protein n=1 Tax=Streptomyces sp. NPDC087440 TaxID=3365790 RepID=UPI0038019036
MPVGELWEVGDDVFGQYRVTGVHTDGGMGLVYRVRHREWDTDLAVKCPRPELFRTPEQQRAFVREAETWVSLGLHPHVCGCHYVRVLGGVPRVFAEYVPGGSLRDRIRDGSLYEGGPREALARVLDLAVQTAWGLQHAHERGLVHQDVKPANVLLDTDGTAKVTDFGIASACAAQGGEAAPVGMTMAYASPEQARHRPLTVRTDVYSFAVSLLEMFSGEVTWLMGPVAGEALTALREEPEGPLDLPHPVAELLAHCLRDDPAERPESMAAVADQLIVLYGELTGRAYPRPQPRAAGLRADELNNRALSLLDLGRTDEAETAFEDALRIDPRHPEATYNAGLARWRRGAATDEDLISALEAAGADTEDAARVRPLLDEVHRERGATGAEDDVRAVSWFPHGANDGDMRLTRDGRRALSCVGGRVRLWDLATGRCLRELDGTHGEIDLAEDGRRAVAVGSDGLVRLWDAEAGRCLQTFTPYYRSGDTAVRRPRLLPGPGLVVAGTSDGTLLGWDLATGRVRWTWEGFHSGPTEATADGRRVLFYGREGTVVLHDPGGACEPTVMPAQNRYTSPLALAADGRTAATATYDRVQLWDTRTGEELRSLAAAVGLLDLSPDGRLLAGASRDGAVRLWDVATGRTLRTYRGHESEIGALVFLDDGRHLLTAGRDNTVRRRRLPGTYTAATRLSRPRRHDELSSLDARVAALVADADRARRAGRPATALDRLRTARAVPGHERDPRALDAWHTLARDPYINRTVLRASWPTRTLGRFGVRANLALSPDGRTAAIRLPLELHLLDVETGERGTVIEGLRDSFGMNVLRSVHFTADGRTVLTANANGSLDAWSVADGTRQASLSLTLGAFAAGFTGDGKHALVWGADQRVRLWEMASGTCLRTLEADHGRDAELWLAPDGRTAATAGSGNTVRTWDLTTGRCLRELRGHTAPVEAIAVDEERGLLVSSGGRGDGRLRLWDLQQGVCLREFDAQPHDARAVRLTPDARFALSRDGEGALRLWELATGRCLRALEGGFGDAVFGPDGCWALMAEAEGAVRIWEFDWELTVDPAASEESEQAEPSEQSGTSGTTGTRKGTDVSHSRVEGGRAAGRRRTELAPLLQALVRLTADPELDTQQARHRHEAQTGDSDAMIRLGAALLDQGDTDGALREFRRAADLGSPMAMSNLSAVFNRIGQKAEAAAWQRRAAEHGYPAAMVQEGFRAYDAGQLGEAERWLRGAAEQDDKQGMLVLGMLLNENGRAAEAEKWLRGAADQGHPSAMYSLAILVQNAGREAEAEQWYRKAADKDHPQAMNNLGNILRHSDRAADAEQWYRRSAEAGEPMGMLNLGEVLETVRPAEAVEWYRRAAAKGSERAVAHLARLRAV